jgi:hypothetical protein
VDGEASSHATFYNCDSFYEHPAVQSENSFHGLRSKQSVTFEQADWKEWDVAKKLQWKGLMAITKQVY